MKITRLFFSYFKKKYNFVPVFTKQAVFLKQAGVALTKMTATLSLEEWKVLEKEVKVCEVQGDAILNDFIDQLYEGIRSNIGKVDMQNVAMHIDEFLDGINNSAKSFLLYEPGRIDSNIQDLAQYIETEAGAIMEIMPLLNNIQSNFQELTMQCDRITELEHAADDSYEEYIAFLFRNEKDPIELIKYKNIAETLEATTDLGKKVSDIIRQIVIRYVNKA